VCSCVLQLLRSPFLGRQRGHTRWHDLKFWVSWWTSVCLFCALIIASPLSLHYSKLFEFQVFRMRAFFLPAGWVPSNQGSKAPSSLQNVALKVRLLLCQYHSISNRHPSPTTTTVLTKKSPVAMWLLLKAVWAYMLTRREWWTEWGGIRDCGRTCLLQECAGNWR